MQIEAKFEYPNVVPGVPQENHLLLRLRTPANPSLTQRQPIVIGLAIDKSWSMKGDKIEAVIEASCALVNWLTRHDLLAIIAYSADVQIIQAVTHLTEKISVSDRLRSIQVGTSTNLSGGWLSALRAVEAASVPNAYKRVILLTDGNPTSGIKEPAPFIQIAKDHFARGISTTTIGVGNDFNESMLVDIAKAGGGNFYFVDNPEGASDIFFQEFGDIGALYAQAIDLELTLAPGVHFKELLNDFSHQVSEEIAEFQGDAKSLGRQKINIQTGDIRSDDIRNIVVKLEIDESIRKIEEPVFHSKVTYYNLVNQMKLESQEMDFPIQYGDVKGKQDPDVLVEMLVANAGKGISKISELVKQGNLEDARLILLGLIQDIEANKQFSPNALGSLVHRLQLMDAKIQEKSNNLTKHIFAGSSFIARGPEKIDMKGVQVHDEIFEFKTKGDIDLYKCPEIKTMVEKKLEEGFRYVVFDFSDTAHIDSSAIGTLIQIVGWLRRRGGEFIAANIRDSVKKVFEITRLYNHIRVAETLPLARETLQRIIFANQGEVES
ncbi:anti-sigma factor antagonist [Leptospira ilyithenensis]|uniref:Anti-sigma factor antagonist n=1 Tax=Leptospira ilyithenensis TaxID=2484901 RepID=A0A4R9LS08_9LEPT|nr:anti-sigma factor antagonist [Leptospira ilyithenensis]TGN10938.1 VWA domain-containing protein [Leptospira ilyithenensis]